MNVTTSKQRGFTLIEVILVLAIAALIFLMVFIALPALQESQRDTARKNDAAAVASAVQSFVAGERRALTTSTADRTAVRGYINDLDQYETTNVNVLATAPNGTSPTVGADEVRIYVGNKCNGTILATGTPRSAAVMIRLEGGSGNNNYCVDV